MEQSIEDILKTIDQAIAGFQDKIPGLQKLIFEELQPLLKEIDIKNGKILNNIKNLKLLGSLKNKLEKVIINAEYKSSVTRFIESFSAVSNLQNNYFAQFNHKFRPKQTLPVLKELVVEATINSLVGQGLQVNVIGGVEKILQQNITTGGSYSALQDVIRNHILSNETGEGSLERYTKQITTDAIHQYNAQYHEAIAQDLQFNWGRYVGSNLTTSRQFCVLLTEQQWVHKSKLPDIIKGHIGNVNCKLSKTTGLPLGMIPGTNADNFKVLRGGYNCGHQFFWVPDSSVPEDTKKNLLDKPVSPTPEPAKEPTTAEKVLATNKPLLDEFKKKGYEIDEDLFSHLGDEISFAKSRKQNAWYQPGTNQVVIGAIGKRINSDYFKKMIFPHEIGHAIHHTRGIIHKGQVNEDFRNHFSELQGLIKGKEKAVQDLIMAKRKAGISQDQAEQLCTIADILGSLTRGQYGYGHTKSYYRRATAPESEIFAHGISLTKTGNQFSDLTPEMEQVIVKMISYSKGL